MPLHRRQTGPRQHFPEPRRGNVKRRRHIAPHQRQFLPQRRRQPQRQHRPHAAPAPDPPRQGQHQRPEDIELLLHPQAPQVQQRFGVGRGIEIAALAIEHEIGHKRRRRRDMAAQLVKALIKQLRPAHRQRRGQHRHQRGINPPHPPRIEAGEGQSLPFQITQQDAGNEIAGDDEKHVHPDKAAKALPYPGMKGDHHPHADRAQPVDIGAVGGVGCGHARSCAACARAGQAAPNPPAF